ncbi:MAG: nuclear transport factor 2 family protein [Candidatus Nitrosocosmicus sp.]
MIWRETSTTGSIGISESIHRRNGESLGDHCDVAVCIHPGWDLLTGWLGIRESWVAIFQNTRRIEFLMTNAKI